MRQTPHRTDAGRAILPVSARLSEGVEALLDVVSDLMRGVSVALLSTAWGIILGIPAAVLHEVLFSEQRLKKSFSDHSTTSAQTLIETGSNK